MSSETHAIVGDALPLGTLLGVSGDGALMVSGVTMDSRRVRPGFLFVAVPGAKADGRDFIDQAVAAGAVAVLSTPDAAPRAKGVAFIADPEPRRAYTLIAARIQGYQPNVQVAVTGTNGKTSVADFTRQIWQAAGHKAASYGTLGLIGDGVAKPGGLTTPDAMALYATLADVARADIQHLAIEASSHGLDQYRLEGMAIQAAAFTNLTRDHLDYHGSFEAYYLAKARLFSELLQRGGTAVVTTDDVYGRRVADLCDGLGHAVIRTGRAPSANLRLIGQTLTETGQTLVLDIEGDTYMVALPLMGAFQADNALSALGLALATGVSRADGLAALEGLKGVSGRMDFCGVSASGGAVYVDYAHTPSGLETVLNAARGHTTGALHVVFGCGGDRDKGKRPEMGAVATRLADRVIVTDDNPRSEDAAVIRAEVLAGAPNALEVADRAEAIAVAVNALAPGDLLIVAGKGHEEGQIVGDTVLPFSDQKAVTAALGDEAILPAEGQGV